MSSENENMRMIAQTWHMHLGQSKEGKETVNPTREKANLLSYIKVTRMVLLTRSMRGQSKSCLTKGEPILNFQCPRISFLMNVTITWSHDLTFLFKTSFNSHKILKEHIIYMWKMLVKKLFKIDRFCILWKINEKFLVITIT